MSRRARHDRQLKQPRQDHEEQEEREPRMKSRQVRRRLHTTSRGAFQGREPLDMAEARREIAAALRTHRAAAAAAATRRSGDQQLPQLQQQQQQPEHEQVVLWRRPPASCDAFFSGHLRDSPPADFTAAGAGASCSSSSSTLRCLAPPATIGGGIGRLACSLPARPLGLSLSFQGFGGSSVHDDAKNSDDRLIIEPSPDSSCSVCASPLAAAAMLSHGGSSQAPVDAAAEQAPSARPVPLPPVLEGLYPIGERRGAEWSDDGRAAVDVATPTWWADLLDQITEDDGGGNGKLVAPAGEEGGKQGIVTGSGKPDGVLEMHLAADDDDYYYHYCHQGDGDGDGDGKDITLPCMEIGEIEGWDGEWSFSP